MQLIYRCLHCGAQNEVACPAPFNDRRGVLNDAYNGVGSVPKATQHACDPNTTGVAQLIAVRDD